MIVAAAARQHVVTLSKGEQPALLLSAELRVVRLEPGDAHVSERWQQTLVPVVVQRMRQHGDAAGRVDHLRCAFHREVAAPNERRAAVVQQAIERLPVIREVPSLNHRLRDMRTPHTGLLRDLFHALPLQRVAERGKLGQHALPPVVPLVAELEQLLAKQNVCVIDEVAEDVNVGIAPAGMAGAYLHAGDDAQPWVTLGFRSRLVQPLRGIVIGQRRNVEAPPCEQAHEVRRRQVAVRERRVHMQVDLHERSTTLSTR